MSVSVPQSEKKTQWWLLIIPAGLLIIVFVLIEVFGVIPD